MTSVTEDAVLPQSTSFGSIVAAFVGLRQARSKHKMTGGLSEWPALTPPTGFGPSVKAYFLVHVISLHLSTIPFVLVSNFPFGLTLTK